MKFRPCLEIEMKKLVLAISMLAASTAGAFAADLAARPYTKAPVVAPTPIYNWTGCYIGAQGGGTWGRTGYDLDIPPTPDSGFDFHANGGVAGGHGGCNYQVGAFVFGVEGDAEWTNLRGNDGGQGGTIDQINGRWDGSLRGRVGWASGPVLFYGTGGVEWLSLEYSRPNFDSLTITKTLTGWTAGGGVEYMFSPNWSVRAEYRYARFDSEGFPFTTGSQRTLRVLETDTIRAGVSYHFGGPVVAKY